MRRTLVWGIPILVGILSSAAGQQPRRITLPIVEEVYADGRMAIVRAVWKLEVKTADGKTETKVRNRSMDVFRFGDDGRWQILRSMNCREKG